MVIGDGVKQSCLRNSIQLAKRQCQNQQVTRQLLLTLSPFTLAEWTVPLKHFPTDFKLQNGPGPQTVPALFSHFFFSEKGKRPHEPLSIQLVNTYSQENKQTKMQLSPTIMTLLQSSQSTPNRNTVILTTHASWFHSLLHR